VKKCSGKTSNKKNYFLEDILKKSFFLVVLEPYLNTTTSKQVENTKAFELTIIKELGKLTTVTSGEGEPLIIINIKIMSRKHKIVMYDCLIKTKHSAIRQ